jgi:hypothetical protein
LEEIVAAPVNKTENTIGGIRCADHATSSIRKGWYYFAKKRRSLGRRGSLADQSHGVFFYALPHGVPVYHLINSAALHYKEVCIGKVCMISGLVITLPKPVL